MDRHRNIGRLDVLSDDLSDNRLRSNDSGYDQKYVGTTVNFSKLKKGAPTGNL